MALTFDSKIKELPGTGMSEDQVKALEEELNSAGL